MMQLYDAIIASYIKKEWHVGQEEINRFKCLRTMDGREILIDTNLEDPEKGFTLAGYPVKITGYAGVALVCTFHDGSKHVVELNIKELIA